MEIPKVSIIIPTADVEGKKFLPRCLESIKVQNYLNYEVLICDEGKVAHNMNQGIKKATGDIIKILCHDDYLAYPDSLNEIVFSWTKPWLVSGCSHDLGTGEGVAPHYAGWNDHIHRGYNTIGGLSVLAFENKDPLLFTEGLDWMVDVDYYRRLYDRYGMPRFLVTRNVIIGYGDHQSTNHISDDQKQSEMQLMVKNYGE